MKKSVENSKILALKAKQGDAEAFGQLFDQYSDKIYRFIFYKVSKKEVAEDLTSQSFLKVWEQIVAGSEIKSFIAFIYRIARNLVIDYYRSREKEELPLIYEINPSDDSLKFNPGENLNQEQLEKLLFSLKGEVREIVILRFIEDLSIKEIAKIMDRSAGNVRVIIHRALKELNKYVNE
jgi:RNA polymerase sigma-70 factor (ECF subfamily)